MGTVAPQPTLSRLRQSLAEIDPSHAPRLAGAERLIGLASPIDQALGGGLACGALHELAPTAPINLGATSGFALAVAARASGERRQVLWVTTDYAAGEGGGPYGPGLDLFGMA
jgi:protein ImuA